MALPLKRSEGKIAYTERHGALFQETLAHPVSLGCRWTVVWSCCSQQMVTSSPQNWSLPHLQLSSWPPVTIPSRRQMMWRMIRKDIAVTHRNKKSENAKVPVNSFALLCFVSLGQEGGGRTFLVVVYGIDQLATMTGRAV